jgi:PIN domain nuclease of toxin-antitoxin system
VILLDTHVVLWYFSNSTQLGRASRELIDRQDRTNPFHVSAVSAWEIALLVKRGRMDLGKSALTWFEEAKRLSSWRSIPLDIEIAIESAALPGEFHNDPADRFLVATARFNGFTLITADGAILEYSKAGHVKAIDASL